MSDSKNQDATETVASPLTNRCSVRQYITPNRYLTAKSRSRFLIDQAVRQDLSDCCTGKSDWPCLLTGGVGSGKTCAMLALCDFYGGVYVTLADWCELVTRAKCNGLWAYSVWQTLAPWVLRPTGDTRQMAVDHVVHLPQLWATEWDNRNLICIDEIGIREPTGVQREILQRCLDGREGKPLVLATNLVVEELESVYDARIVSRLMAGTVIEMPAVDRRLQRT